MKKNYFFMSGMIVLIIVFIVVLYKNDVYNVVFAIDNDVYKTMEVRKKSFIKENIIPEKEGQIFLGWYDDDGNRLEENTLIQKDTVYRARWGIISEEE